MGSGPPAMRHLLSLVLTLVCCVLTSNAQAVIPIEKKWEKSYPGNKQDVYIFVIENPGGGTLQIETTFNNWVMDLEDGLFAKNVGAGDSFISTTNYDVSDFGGKEKLSKNKKIYKVKIKTDKNKPCYILVSGMLGGITASEMVLKVGPPFPVWAIVLIVIAVVIVIAVPCVFCARKSWKRTKETPDEVVYADHMSFGLLMGMIFFLSMGLPFLIIGINVDILRIPFCIVGSLTIVISLFFCGPTVTTMDIEYWEVRRHWWFVVPMGGKRIPTVDISHFFIRHSHGRHGTQLGQLCYQLKNGTVGSVEIGASNVCTSRRENRMIAFNRFLMTHGLGDPTAGQVTVVPVPIVTSPFVPPPQHAPMVQPLFQPGPGQGPVPMANASPYPAQGMANAGPYGPPPGQQPGPYAPGPQPGPQPGPYGPGPQPDHGVPVSAPAPLPPGEYEPGQKPHGQPAPSNPGPPPQPQQQQQPPPPQQQPGGAKLWICYGDDRDQVELNGDMNIAGFRSLVKDRLGLDAPPIKITIAESYDSQALAPNVMVFSLLAKNSYDTPLYVNVNP